MAMSVTAKKRHDAEFVIENAIMHAIDRLIPGSNEDSYPIYAEWTKEEDGQIAIDRLVNLIIY